VEEMLTKRRDGKYVESFADNWLAEYSESPQTGLWKVEIFQHDVSRWVSQDYALLDEARTAALDYFVQS